MYGENEQRYLFKGVIVGHSSRARFKIRNTNKVCSAAIVTELVPTCTLLFRKMVYSFISCKVIVCFCMLSIGQVPCDLVFSIKSVNSKLKSMTEAFEVHPSNKVSILPHSYITASVTFKPPAMQVMNAQIHIHTFMFICTTTNLSHPLLLLTLSSQPFSLPTDVHSCIRCCY